MVAIVHRKDKKRRLAKTQKGICRNGEWKIVQSLIKLKTNAFCQADLIYFLAIKFNYGYRILCTNIFQTKNFSQKNQK